MTLRSQLVELEAAIRAGRNEAERLRDRLAIAAMLGQDAALRQRASTLATQIIDLDARASRITTAATAIAGEAIAIDAAVTALRAEAAALADMAAKSPASQVEQAATWANDLARLTNDQTLALRAALSLLPREAPYDKPDPAVWRGTAPSGLPFWHGGFRGLDELAGLQAGTPHANDGALDLVMDYDAPSSNAAIKAATTIRSWDGSPATRYLTTGKARCFVWTAHPFNGGNPFATPMAWPTAEVPADISFCPNRPPTYTGLETPPERREKQLRVWKYGAEGAMDNNWRNFLIAMKRDYFLKRGLTGIRIVFRAAHELDLTGTWGNTYSPRCNSVAFLSTASDMAVVKQALSRYMHLFLEVFGQRQPEITGDVAWPVDELWTHFNPVKENFLPLAADIMAACPDNAHIVGPDYYDRYPANMSTNEFARNIGRMNVPAGTAPNPRWTRGLAWWRDWCRANGRVFGVPEWGIWCETFAADGISRPQYEGWDNPVFVERMLSFFAASADVIGPVVYFNVDIAKESSSFPGHRIAPWDGIDDPAIPCARIPIGDNGQCAARAYRQWMMT